MVFFATYFGFDPSTARRYSDGVIIIRDAEDFALALGEAQDSEHTPGFPHSDSIWTPLRRSRHFGPALWPTALSSSMRRTPRATSASSASTPTNT